MKKETAMGLSAAILLIGIPIVGMSVGDGAVVSCVTILVSLGLIKLTTMDFSKLADACNKLDERIDRAMDPVISLFIFYGIPALTVWYISNPESFKAFWNSILGALK